LNFRLCFTLYGKSGFEIDHVPNATADTIPSLISLFASSIETESFAIRLVLNSFLIVGKKSGI